MNESRETEKVKLNRWCGDCNVRCEGEKCSYCGKVTYFPSLTDLECLELLEEARLETGGEEVTTLARFQKTGKVKAEEWLRGMEESMRDHFLTLLEHLDKIMPRDRETREQALRAFLVGWGVSANTLIGETAQGWRGLRDEFPEVDKKAREVLMEDEKEDANE